MLRLCVVVLWVLGVLGVTVLPLGSQGFESRFASLAGWRLINFEDDQPPSQFDPVTYEDREVLRVISDGSASMIIREDPIKIYETPIVSWRWKLVEPLESANLRSLFSEDTSIRMMVAFRHELDELPLWLRVWAGRQEKRHGEVPPTSALNYVWATQDYGAEPFGSLYSKRIQFYVKNYGEREVGSWQEHRVNVVEDYRRAHGDDPPAEAFIAIMSDADNTDGYAEALVEYVTASVE